MDSDSEDQVKSRQTPSRGVLVLIAAAVLLVGGALAVFFSLSGKDSPSAPAPTSSMGGSGVVESVGSLVVGSGAEAVSVPQTSCPTNGDGAFECTESGEVPTVTSGPGTLPLSSEGDTDFLVAAVPLGADDVNPGPITINGDELDFTAATPGVYQITVLGSDFNGQRPTWQFLLEVVV